MGLARRAVFANVTRRSGNADGRIRPVQCGRVVRGAALPGLASAGCHDANVIRLQIRCSLRRGCAAAGTSRLPLAAYVIRLLVAYAFRSVVVPPARGFVIRRPLRDLVDQRRLADRGAPTRPPTFVTAWST